MSSVILAELAEGLVEVDTAGWAEGWEKLSAESRKALKRLPKKWKSKVEAMPLLLATE